MMNREDIICALSTPPGSGAIAIVRLTGKGCIELIQSIFKGKDLSQEKAQTIHFGSIEKEEKVLDEVLISLFRSPHSYTGEDIVEISCHASPYIIEQLLELLVGKGARIAEPGEFTQRAFLNGKLDLSQAEAVADLIASESRAAHNLAMNQMRGGFSKKIQELREELIQFTSLIELELDFSEEDVEFADRDDLKALVRKILDITKRLIDSFASGNVIKNGIPVAIVGAPNVGKSTLLNALLNEERAIVSEIAGTTRDSIEDEIRIAGISFRFIDTAGIRETNDQIEGIGIQRTFEMIDKASIILYLIDAVNMDRGDLEKDITQIKDKISGTDKQLLIIVNKIDQLEEGSLKEKLSIFETPILLSALKKTHMEELTEVLADIAKEKLPKANQVIVSNARHHQALKGAAEALERVEDGLNKNVTGDFLAMDIRQALHFLGEITGSIEIDRDILGTIFSQFCIGK